MDLPAHPGTRAGTAVRALPLDRAAQRAPFSGFGEHLWPLECRETDAGTATSAHETPEGKRTRGRGQGRAQPETGRRTPDGRAGQARVTEYAWASPRPLSGGMATGSKSKPVAWPRTDSDAITVDGAVTSTRRAARLTVSP